MSNRGDIGGDEVAKNEGIRGEGLAAWLGGRQDLGYDGSDLVLCVDVRVPTCPHIIHSIFGYGATEGRESIDL